MGHGKWVWCTVHTIVWYTIHPCKQPLPFLFIHSLQVLEGHNEVSPEPSLLQAKQAQFPQPFLIGELLQPSDHLSGPPLELLQELHVLPVLGALGLDSVLQVEPHRS